MKLEDKVAIVTGAGAGIGQAIALRFAKEGAHVVVADIDIERANKVAEEIKALDSRAIPFRIDVKNNEEAKQMVKATLDEFGKIDILVNNAGGSARERATLFHESTEEVCDFVIDQNLKGTFNCTRAVLPHMLQKRSGKILSTASSHGINASGAMAKGTVEYSAAKAGVIGFTKALAKEVGRHGINVNCFSPGPTATAGSLKAFPTEFKRIAGRNYTSRVGTPEDAASVAAFLASDEASQVTGANYVVDGGETLGWYP